MKPNRKSLPPKQPPAGRLLTAVQDCASKAATSPDFETGMTVVQWTTRWWQANSGRYKVLVANDRQWLDALVGLARAIRSLSSGLEAAYLSVRIWQSLCTTLRTRKVDPVSEALATLPAPTIRSDRVVRLAVQVLAGALTYSGFVSLKKKVVTVAAQPQRSERPTSSIAAEKRSVSRAVNLERWRLQHPIKAAIGSGKNR
ncbi:MAG: hypothetical protein K0R39_1119 [Symbiobacteriaceae bacterium]|jgi:hypothetical protein|nr:hypothetical protein [Symbiobacteriaceae bacterium]